ncbi:MAG: methylated-DNA--[protein]-cysteine S-methyltransferase [Candidatus Avelusimicrobium sp.]
MHYKTTYHSPLGKMTLVSDGKNLSGLWIDGQKHAESTLGERIEEKSDLAIFKQTKNWLERYFRGARPEIAELPLAPAGGAFRQAVWKILREIPYGQVITYGEIANRIAKERGVAKMSAQAVGQAVGHNPISVIIPCHRVVGANGNLTGYAGGIHLKIHLLAHEGITMDNFFIPRQGTAR